MGPWALGVPAPGLPPKLISATAQESWCMLEELLGSVPPFP